MLGKIFGALAAVSFIFALISGRAELLGPAAMKGASDAVTLAVSLAGVMCLWSGLMGVLEKTGAAGRLSAALGWLTKLLFPGAHKKTGGAGVPEIAANISANLLGLGNAATPIGLRAMEKLSRLNDDKGRASDDMIMFVLVNCAALQLVPATLIALRGAAGSSKPAAVLVPVWICSGTAFVLSVLLCKLFSGRRRGGGG